MIDDPTLFLDCKRLFQGKAMLKAPLFLKQTHHAYLKARQLKGVYAFILKTIKNKWGHDHCLKNHKNKEKIKAELRQKKDALIWSWIDDRCFANDKFQEIYLKNIYPILNQEEKSWIIITHSTLSKAQINKGYDHLKIIPLTYFLKWADICRLMIQCFKYKITLDKNNDCVKLCEFGLKKDVIYGRVEMLEGRLHRCLITRALQQIKINKIIYPFENQPYEKMMILAKEQLNHPIQTIAYQHASLPSLLLNYHVSHNEKAVMPQPDIIVANGKKNQRILNEAGFTSKIINGGSLRYNHSSSKIQVKKKSENQKKVVLILLTYDSFQSIELLRALTQINDSNEIFLIKPHPHCSQEKIQKIITSLPENFIFTRKPITEIKHQAKKVVHAGTTAAIECMDERVPIINFIPETIALDSLTTIWPEQEAIDEKNIQKINEIGTFFSQELTYFEKVNEEQWKDLISDK